MRFFIDTNVIISAALFPKGKAAYIFSHIIESHEVIISSYTLNEGGTVFHNKFPDKFGELQTFLNSIDYVLFLTPDDINAGSYPKIRNLKDLPILASAILSDADVLITGDKDLEDIALTKPLIFSPTGYYDLIRTRNSLRKPVRRSLP